MSQTGHSEWKARTAALRRPATTPRPTFDGPAHIARRDASLHLWGNDEAGDVADWVYCSTDKIHHLMFGLAPGQSFRHSEDFRTIFGADEVLYVLTGTMSIANPQTGEVRRIQAGDAAFFRADTWHHAFSLGPDELRVVEFFSPPPAAGASSAYAVQQVYLESTSYQDRRWQGRWPMAQTAERAAATIHHLTDADLLWSMTGEGTMLGTYASTEHIHVARLEQAPGGRSGARCFEGDTAIHVLEGTVFVFILDENRQRWFEGTVGDGFFVPAGTHYEIRNVTAAPSRAIVAVAPNEIADSGG